MNKDNTNRCVNVEVGNLMESHPYTKYNRQLWLLRERELVSPTNWLSKYTKQHQTDSSRYIYIFMLLCVITITKKVINLRSGGNGEGIRERDMGGVEKRKVKVEVM